jgi:long-chain fatty acid transport protein
MDATSTRPLTLHQALPDIIRVGSRWRPLDTFEMRISGSFTRWSVNQTQCAGLRGLPCVVNAMGSAVPGSGVIKNLRREWNDTFGIRGGLSYWPVPILELFTGLGFENAAIPDETLDPVAVDANNITASLGARLQVFETWFGALSYEHQQFLPRDNTGRSQLADPMIGAATRAADGGGRYTAWFGMIHLNLAKTF